MHSPTATVRVWDRFVRVFHWSLVASFATAYFWTEHIDWVHKGAGYLALGLVLARAVWGFVASNPYARFTQFVPTPGRLLTYLGQLLRGSEARHLGHNPAGAVMIVYLLLATLTIGVSGHLMTTDAFWGNGLVEDIHVMTVDATVIAVIVHVAATLYESLKHRENMFKAMVTGRKRDTSSAPPQPDWQNTQPSEPAPLNRLPTRLR